jgi:beta-xylosidase
MKRLITLCLLGGCFLSAPAQNYVSQAWVADQGNGTYKNPVLYADYSDPDVCRVGDDYYLTSSSFNCLPGLQILHSKDLVNWTIIGAAVPYALPPVTDVRPEHGNRVWAPSIRHHNGEFYIFWGDPDQGLETVTLLIVIFSHDSGCKHQLGEFLNVAPSSNTLLHLMKLSNTGRNQSRM